MWGIEILAEVSFIEFVMSDYVRCTLITAVVFKDWGTSVSLRWNSNAFTHCKCCIAHDSGARDPLLMKHLFCLCFLSIVIYSDWRDTNTHIQQMQCGASSSVQFHRYFHKGSLFYVYRIGNRHTRSFLCLKTHHMTSSGSMSHLFSTCALV